MATATTSIRVDTQLAKAKLQARLDSHNKAFAAYNKAVEKYEADLDKWSLKVIKHKDATKVSTQYHGGSVNVEVPDSMRGTQPKMPREKDFPGILDSRSGYREVSELEALENALGILEMATDATINVNAIKGVGAFLR
jgi:hypothetical protein